MKLRGYQNKALANLGAAFKSGARAPLLVSPTGSGKTVMLSTIVSGHVAKGGTVNWYAHRRELCKQAAETLSRFGLAVGYAGLNAAAPVQVTSVQAALERGELRACSMGILDEAHHHGVTDDWARLMLALKASGALVVGATATPERGDGRGLKEFDRLVVVAQVPELVELWQTDPTQGLVPCTVLAPKNALGKGKIAMLPVDAYVKNGGRGRNVVFAPHVKAAEDYALQFRMQGIEAVVVHAKSKDRDESLERFAAGDVRVLVNVYVLTEGWDCPATEIVTVARSVGSAGMYLQMCGRGARPAPGKTGYTVLDLRGACRIHGRPDELREYSLDGVGIKRAGMRGPRQCGVCKRELGVDEVVCQECGREVPELETPTATGDPLEKFASFQRDPMDVRLARLAKFMREEKAKGNSPYRAIHRYAGTYNGERPTREMIRAAWGKGA